ncbi:MAG TPA: RidA family protein [Thermodesulfobacteriota bacterium]
MGGVAQGVVEGRIEELGLALPEPATPAFNYVPVVVWHDVAYVSGQLPRTAAGLAVTGKLGETVSVEEGREAARLCVLHGLAVLRQALGSLDRIARIVKVTGFVASAPTFHEQPRVIDAASELLIQIFGEAGRHARSAIGAPALPRNTPVEIEFVVALR